MYTVKRTFERSEYTIIAVDFSERVVVVGAIGSNALLDHLEDNEVVMKSQPRRDLEEIGGWRARLTSVLPDPKNANTAFTFTMKLVGWFPSSRLTGY